MRVGPDGDVIAVVGKQRIIIILLDALNNYSYQNHRINNNNTQNNDFYSLVFLENRKFLLTENTQI